MKLFLISIAILLSMSVSKAEEITLDIEINTEFEDYRYFILYLGTNPDTLFIEQKSDYPKKIIFKTEHKLPFAASLIIQTSDKMAMSTNYLEIDTNFMTINIDKINGINKVTGTDFQIHFNSVMEKTLELEKNNKNGKLSEDELNNYYSAMTIKMIEEYPEHPMGYLLVTKVLNKLNESDLKLIKGLINYKGSDNPQIEDINKYVSSMIPIREGYSVGAEIKELTNLILPDKSETNIDLSKGQHFIYIWSTWCGPCINKLKYLNSNLDSFNSKVNLITISVDTDSEKWYRFIDLANYKFPTYLSKENSIMDLFHVTDLPFTILIEDGKVSKLNPNLEDYIK